jgi:hypothetical protein
MVFSHMGRNMTGLPTILNSDTDDARSGIIISADAYKIHSFDKRRLEQW